MLNRDLIKASSIWAKNELLFATILSLLQGSSMSDTPEEKICVNLLKVCDNFLESAQVDKGHGIDHINAVLEHVNRALAVMPEYLLVDDIQKLAIRCATILHDVDDHKFFESSKTCSNAKYLLDTVKPEIDAFLKSKNSALSYQEFEMLVKSMIDLVSCSINGNSNEKQFPEWMLYPRIADRLEAIGQIGILRAIQYGDYKKRQMYDSDTERVFSLEELLRVATPERFQKYLAGIRSMTTIGHFYDKILHIGIYDEFGVDNPYFKEIADSRHKEVQDYVINFWQNLRIDD